MTRNTRRAAALATALMCAPALAGCSGITETGAGSSDGKVTYKVTGDGVTKADMTFTDGGTKTTQETGEKLPWKKTVDAGDDVIVYQVSAQNATMKKGSVSCQILLDGEVVDENTSKGAAAIASCEHTP